MIGSIISMNIYYQKKLGMNVLRMFFRTVKDVVPALLCATAATILVKKPIYGGLSSAWAPFLACCAVFVAVYGAVVFVFNRAALKDLVQRK